MMIHKYGNVSLMNLITAIDENDTATIPTSGNTTEISQTTTMTPILTDAQTLYTYYKAPQGAK